MKKLAVLLITISLSVNAGWFWEKDKDNNKPNYNGGIFSVDTTIDIIGGFGLILGAIYNQDFIKPSDPTISYSGGNSVKAPKPIDILVRYELYVNDIKSAYRILGDGEIKYNSDCGKDFYLLKKSMEKKYKFTTPENNNPLAGIQINNDRQSRRIRFSCNNFSHEPNYSLLKVNYYDDKLLEKYKEKLDKQEKEKEKSIINSYDI